MWGSERDVLKEGGVSVVALVAFEAINCVVGNGSGGVITGWCVGRNGLVVEGGSFDGEVIVLLSEHEGAVKAVFERLSVDVPFTAVVGAVSAGVQKVGEKARPFLADALPSTTDSGKSISMNLLGIEPREGCGAGWPASGSVVEAGVA